MRLTAGAIEALAEFSRAGYALVVITNQSGVARGFFREEALAGVRDRLATLLGSRARLDGFYYCPHAPDGAVARYAIACECRKPAPGLLLAAARDLDLDLSRSWMIGDILDDVEAGRRAGCRTVLIDNGNETEWRPAANRIPDLIVPDLLEAARAIQTGAL